MTRVKLISINCFLISVKGFLIELPGNIPTQNKNAEVALIKLCLFDKPFLKHFATKKF